MPAPPGRPLNELYELWAGLGLTRTAWPSSRSWHGGPVPARGTAGTLEALIHIHTCTCNLQLALALEFEFEFEIGAL